MTHPRYTNHRSMDRYVNRELSWLEFNQRVLDEARDPSVPLLERLKFLAITSSNLDEFFMVRVGGLHLLNEEKPTRRDPSGMTAAEQLTAIANRAQAMTADQYACYLMELEPRLADSGIRRLRFADLTDHQTRTVQNVFDEELYAVLTPMAVSGTNDFPLLVHEGLSVLVELAPAAGDSEPRLAVIPFGPAVARFITLPSDGGYSYMLLEDVVGTFIQRFFPEETVLECVPFRIMRNADLSARDDLAFDLLAEMEQVLRARKESACIRLEVFEGVTGASLDFLQRTLSLKTDAIYRIPGPLDLTSFTALTGLPGFDDLRDKEWAPQPSVMMEPGRSVFEVIRDRDVLLHHPYESFDPVLRFVEEAATDPDVLAIKQSLYRTGRDSPIVAALTRAAEDGKSVTAILELKARFDEARNIEWARKLERAGGQVIYGVMGLKTHSKACLVVRREPQGIQRYAHFGTGNYNEQTARLYTDVSLLTCNDELTADAVAFFNAITGYSQPQRYQKLEAAPLGLRQRLLELIDVETERKRQGQPAAITAKLNSLVDPDVIDALYRASQAGVEIRLNVRGICCLRPGVEGLSENISVVSVVDRFLEHGRILRFHHGGLDLLYISSADWMPRNLDKRIELLVPVEDEACRERLKAILAAPFRDNVKGRAIRADGGFDAPQPPEDQSLRYRSQQRLHEAACEEVKHAEQSRSTMFVPHRAPAE
ncbi:MAG: polyphosphate kinase 1 [Planctomycetaceae bacterium]